MFAVWSWLLQVVLVSTVLAADFSGLVDSVLDGDTIEVLHHTRAERIRLNSIDGPEKGHTLEIPVSIQIVGDNTTPRLV